MRNWLACTAILGLFSFEAGAACTKEAAPAIPDGAGATAEVMGTAQKAVKTYIASANAYLACVQKDLDSANTPKDQKAALNKQYNAAVDEMNDIAARFNAAVKAFKAAQ